MTSTLSDGDWNMFERTQSRLGRDGIYPLAFTDVAWFKRLGPNLTDLPDRIISDNPLYPAQKLEREETTIIARALAVLVRRLKRRLGRCDG